MVSGPVHCGHYRQVVLLYRWSLRQVHCICIIALCVLYMRMYIHTLVVCYCESVLCNVLCLFFFSCTLSDDRSPEIFRQRIASSTQMQAVLSGDSRPNCLIIDEIDGAPAVSTDMYAMYICTFLFLHFCTLISPAIHCHPSGTDKEEGANK